MVKESIKSIWWSLGMSICKNLTRKEQIKGDTNKLNTVTLRFFYKQPVYNQLALGWKIAKQLSGLNPLSLSNCKNYRLKKSGVVPL